MKYQYHQYRLQNSASTSFPNSNTPLLPVTIPNFKSIRILSGISESPAHGIIHRPTQPHVIIISEFIPNIELAMWEN